MRKDLAIILILCATALPAGQTALTNVKFLQKKTLEMRYAIGSSEMKFIDDRRYRSSYSSGGWYWKNEGTYELRNGKVYLHPVKCEEVDDGQKAKCQNSMGEAVGTLIDNENSFDYLKSLKVVSLKNRKIYSYDGSGGNAIVYNILEFPVKEGSIRNAGGVRVVAMGCRAGRTTADAKMYKRPGIASEPVKCSIEYDSDGSSVRDYLPDGTEITVLARSTEKQKVNDRNDYWYYVNAGACERVWIHGAFVDRR